MKKKPRVFYQILISHTFIECLNFWRRLAVNFSPRDEKQLVERTHKVWSNSLAGRTVTVLGNGPSLSEVDFKKIRSNATAACNFFYKENFLEDFSPNFYFIIDGKLQSGEWPITMVDDILEKYPQTNLFLNVSWVLDNRFRRFRSHHRVFWIRPCLIPSIYIRGSGKLNGCLFGGNVMFAAISFFLNAGVSKVEFGGIDGDGLFRQLTKQKTHHYEGNYDPQFDSFFSVLFALQSSVDTLFSWNAWSRYMKKRGILLKNICRSGIMHFD